LALLDLEVIQEYLGLLALPEQVVQQVIRVQLDPLVIPEFLD
tara:strand:- start:575 stop:700 length:126 start_codon:yes stop_codon:yes gene_type:complete